MKKVLLFSFLLIAGLLLSQPRQALSGPFRDALDAIVKHGTLFCLAFIMIQVGREFEVDRGRLKEIGWDYVVAATAAAFPWIFVSLYFMFLLEPADAWRNFDAWKEVLLAGRFAAPTSAGILFSMLAAAGLAATWTFRKVRILAIFDDLDTVLLMIPLKVMIVGWRWQLGVVVAVMLVLLALGWRHLHRVSLPVSWPWIAVYAAGLVAVTEGVYALSKYLDDVVPIHIEILLPAFVLGCVLAHPGRGEAGHDGGPGEERAGATISGVFMALAGLSMPRLVIEGMSVSTLALHVVAVTLVANLGKMFPILCYRAEASLRERLAVCIGMWPRGEVGAGILILSTGYGIEGPIIAVAGLSLALNLVLTGPFIAAVKGLIGNVTPAPRR